MEHCDRKHLQEVLDKNPSCCVLIACGQPSEDGQMQVEMTCHGDPALVSYLLRGAQCFIEEEEEEEEEENETDYMEPNLSIHVAK